VAVEVEAKEQEAMSKASKAKRSAVRTCEAPEVPKRASEEEPEAPKSAYEAEQKAVEDLRTEIEARCAIKALEYEGFRVDVEGAPTLLKALSRKYPGLAISIAMTTEGSTLTVRPTAVGILQDAPKAPWGPWSVRHLDRFRERIVDMGNLWPAPSEVRAFLDGYQAGRGSERPKGLDLGGGMFFTPHIPFRY
jgi:hypothetical protein